MQQAWSGPIPTAAQIEEWRVQRIAEGASVRYAWHAHQGALVPFWCAHDEDGVLYDWFPAHPQIEEGTHPG